MVQVMTTEAEQSTKPAYGTVEHYVGSFQRARDNGTDVTLFALGTLDNIITSSYGDPAEKVARAHNALTALGRVADLPLGDTR